MISLVGLHFSEGELGRNEPGEEGNDPCVWEAEVWKEGTLRSGYKGKIKIKIKQNSKSHLGSYFIYSYLCMSCIFNLQNTCTTIKPGDSWYS